MPKKIGLVDQFFQGQGKLVVVIQDLHCNAEVQKNIAAAIHWLAAEYGLRLIGEEGAFDTVNVSKLRTFPAAGTRKTVSDYFVKQGKLSGAEYYAITGEYPVRVEGIETPALYAASENLLGTFLNPESQGICCDLQEALESLKEEIYGPALRRFDRWRTAYSRGKLELLQYATRLAREAGAGGVGLGDYPCLRELVGGDCGARPGDLSLDVLQAELDALEAAIRDGLYANAGERDLDQAFRQADRMERLLNISATPQDLAEWRQETAAAGTGALTAFLQKQGRTEFVASGLPGLEQALARAGKFYELADQRSDHFVDNLTRKMDRCGEALSVMVVGGYHTEGVLAALRRKHISFVSVRPCLSRQDLVNPYFALLSKKNTPLEKLLAQDQNILALRTVCADGPFAPDQIVKTGELQSDEARIFSGAAELLAECVHVAGLKARGCALAQAAQQMLRLLSDYPANEAIGVDCQALAEAGPSESGAAQEPVLVIPTTLTSPQGKVNVVALPAAQPAGSAAAAAAFQNINIAGRQFLFCYPQNLGRLVGGIARQRSAHIQLPGNFRALLTSGFWGRLASEIWSLWQHPGRFRPPGTRQNRMQLGRRSAPSFGFIRTAVLNRILGTLASFRPRSLHFTIAPTALALMLLLSALQPFPMEAGNRTSPSWEIFSQGKSTEYHLRIGGRLVRLIIEDHFNLSPELAGALLQRAVDDTGADPLSLPELAVLYILKSTNGDIFQFIRQPGLIGIPDAVFELEEDEVVKKILLQVAVYRHFLRLAARPRAPEEEAELWGKTAQFALDWLRRYKVKPHELLHRMQSHQLKSDEFIQALNREITRESQNGEKIIFEDWLSPLADEFAERIWTSLDSPGGCLVSLDGMDGVGKSMFARQVAEQFNEKYQGRKLVVVDLDAFRKTPAFQSAMKRHLLQEWISPEEQELISTEEKAPLRPGQLYLREAHDFYDSRAIAALLSTIHGYMQQGTSMPLTFTIPGPDGGHFRIEPGDVVLVAGKYPLEGPWGRYYRIRARMEDNEKAALERDLHREGEGAPADRAALRVNTEFARVGGLPGWREYVRNSESLVHYYIHIPARRITPTHQAPNVVTLTELTDLPRHNAAVQNHYPVIDNLIYRHPLPGFGPELRMQYQRLSGVLLRASLKLRQGAVLRIENTGSLDFISPPPRLQNYTCRLEHDGLRRVLGTLTVETQTQKAEFRWADQTEDAPEARAALQTWAAAARRHRAFTLDLEFMHFILSREIDPWDRRYIPGSAGLSGEIRSIRREELEGMDLWEVPSSGVTNKIFVVNGHPKLLAKILRDYAVRMDEDETRAVSFENDILPGIRVAQKLGGRAVETKVFREIGVKINGQKRTVDLQLQNSINVTSWITALVAAGDMDRARELIDQFIQMQRDMWAEGIIDFDFQFANNYGYNSDLRQIQIIDFDHLADRYNPRWEDIYGEFFVDYYRDFNTAFLNKLSPELGRYYYQRSPRGRDFLDIYLQGRNVSSAWISELKGAGEEIGGMWPWMKQGLKKNLGIDPEVYGGRIAWWLENSLSLAAGGVAACAWAYLTTGVLAWPLAGPAYLAAWPIFFALHFFGRDEQGRRAPLHDIALAGMIAAANLAIGCLPLSFPVILILSFVPHLLADLLAPRIYSRLKMLGKFTAVLLGVTGSATAIARAAFEGGQISWVWYGVGVGMIIGVVLLHLKAQGAFHIGPDHAGRMGKQGMNPRRTSTQIRQPSGYGDQPLGWWGRVRKAVDEQGHYMIQFAVLAAWVAFYMALGPALIVMCVWIYVGFLPLINLAWFVNYCFKDREQLRVVRYNPLALHSMNWINLAMGLDGIFDLGEFRRNKWTLFKNLNRMVFGLIPGAVYLLLELVLDGFIDMISNQNVLAQKINLIRTALKEHSGISPYKDITDMADKWIYARTDDEHRFLIYHMLQTMFAEEKRQILEDAAENNIYNAGEIRAYRLLQKFEIHLLDETMRRVDLHSRWLYRGLSPLGLENIRGGLNDFLAAKREFYLSSQYLDKMQSGWSDEDKIIYRVLTEEFGVRRYATYEVLRMLHLDRPFAEADLLGEASRPSLKLLEERGVIAQAAADGQYVLNPKFIERLQARGLDIDGLREILAKPEEDYIRARKQAEPETRRGSRRRGMLGGRLLRIGAVVAQTTSAFAQTLNRTSGDQGFITSVSGRRRVSPAAPNTYILRRSFWLETMPAARRALMAGMVLFLTAARAGAAGRILPADRRVWPSERINSLEIIRDLKRANFPASPGLVRSFRPDQIELRILTPAAGFRNYWLGQLWGHMRWGPARAGDPQPERPVVYVPERILAPVLAAAGSADAAVPEMEYRVLELMLQHQGSRYFRDLRQSARLPGWLWNRLQAGQLPGWSGFLPTRLRADLHARWQHQKPGEYLEHLRSRIRLRNSAVMRDLFTPGSSLYQAYFAWAAIDPGQRAAYSGGEREFVKTLMTQLEKYREDEAQHLANLEGISQLFRHMHAVPVMLPARPAGIRSLFRRQGSGLLPVPRCLLEPGGTALLRRLQALLEGTPYALPRQARPSPRRREPAFSFHGAA